ncbi:MAG: hypothetical protein JRJ00_06675, partial [Deltaproteobacteria bacterium]|nr:hypothetical protein [Deltaproteobacteria bacterium]
SAIVVTPLGELRLKDGSYIEEAKILELDLKEEKGYDSFLLEDEKAHK